MECVFDVASDLSFESSVCVCVGGVRHVLLLEMFIFYLSSPGGLVVVCQTPLGFGARQGLLEQSQFLLEQ